MEKMRKLTLNSRSGSKTKNSWRVDCSPSNKIRKAWNIKEKTTHKILKAALQCACQAERPSARMCPTVTCPQSQVKGGLYYWTGTPRYTACAGTRPLCPQSPSQGWHVLLDWNTQAHSLRWNAPLVPPEPQTVKENMSKSIENAKLLT